MEWKDMKVEGVVVSAATQAAAWHLWNPFTGVTGLMFALDKAYGENLDQHYRAADRMLQKARKAGKAVYAAGKWRKL